MKFGLAIVLGVMTLTACSSGQLSIESDPVGADIELTSSDGGKQLIGKTPMTINSASNPKIFSENAQLTIRKNGFHGETFVIPKAAGSVNGRIKAQLREDEVTQVCQDSIRTLMEATDQVAQIQRMIYRKDYFEAEKALSGLVVKFASVPVFHSLLGNVYYLQKNLNKALESYERANILQPQNHETLRMIEKLKGIRFGVGGGT